MPLMNRWVEWKEMTTCSLLALRRVTSVGWPINTWLLPSINFFLLKWRIHSKHRVASYTLRIIDLECVYLATWGECSKMSQKFVNRKKKARVTVEGRISIDHGTWRGASNSRSGSLLFIVDVNDLEDSSWWHNIFQKVRNKILVRLRGASKAPGPWCYFQREPLHLASVCTQDCIKWFILGQ